MNSTIEHRLDALRQAMKAHGIDAAIILHTDPHQSEYIADHWQTRRYLSGFTGSAGTLVVTLDKALLWTDSRYFIQAANQLQGTGIELMKDGLEETPSITQYLTKNLKLGDTVGIDGMLLSYNSAKEMHDELAAHTIELDTNFDCIDEIWPDRPHLPKDAVFEHETMYAGEPANSKLAKLIANIKEQGADSTLISALDEIAWALNIRSTDVKYNPVAISYLYISDGSIKLFVDLDKISPEIKEYLHSQGVETLPYSGVKAFLETLPQETVLIEGSKTSIAIADLLEGRAEFSESLCAMPKSVKNQVQIEGIRAAMERDGVALVKSVMEIENRLANGDTVTELDVDAILLKHRSQQPLFFDESFGTIAAYADHGAIVHYEPTDKTNVELKRTGLLLIDSGAQYLDGTTDITRTIALGNPTLQEKQDFTLVMKGHIALAKAIFPEGTRGVQLDVLARQFLWNEGLTYLHGTGHGVGQFLNVHEGPQGIRTNYLPAPLMPGMVTSDEPGLYRENIHGIRCENLLLTVPAMTTDFGKFLKFETLTLFPFDSALLLLDIMTDEEINWINDYHAEVRRRLKPLLNEKERAWLEYHTMPIIRR